MLQDKRDPRQLRSKAVFAESDFDWWTLAAIQYGANLAVFAKRGTAAATIMAPMRFYRLGLAVKSEKVNP